jgi:hypothetical protein
MEESVNEVKKRKKLIRREFESFTNDDGHRQKRLLSLIIFFLLKRRILSILSCSLRRYILIV